MIASLIALLFAIQLVSIVLAGWRLRRQAPPHADTPICLLVPVCGLDHAAETTLAAFLNQNHPNHRVLFCAATDADPVVPLVRTLIAGRANARLLIGDDRPTRNPKLNNILKGWQADTAPIVAIVDSNALTPPDYLTQLAAASGTAGLVTSPAIGTQADGLWAATEGAFLNTHQARWQFAADLLGRGFAQGKTLCWSRNLLDSAGGPTALGRELAEDVASTKLARRLGTQIRLVARPVEQPLGRRTLPEVWARQLRWARIRRQGFVWLFLPEILLGGALPLTLLAVTQPALLIPGILLWYGAEWALARANGWPAPIAPMLLRDAMMPALWLWSFTSRSIAWRGNTLAPNAT